MGEVAGSVAMTENAQVQPDQQVPQEQQAPVDQAPPTQTQEKGLRFYVRVQDMPSAENYMEPMSLHRFDDSGGHLVMERFHPEERRWIDNPNLISVTGLGGDEDYVEIDEEKANQLIDQWSVKEPLEDADDNVGGDIVAEDVPEYDFSKRPQEGEDHTEVLEEFLERITSAEDEEEEIEERSLGVKITGALRRLFNAE